MAKIIGFSEYVNGYWSKIPSFNISYLRELKPFVDPVNGSIYLMVHNGPNWSIGYQSTIRYFLDDGTFVDFVDNCTGQIQFLMDYIANGGDTQSPQKFEITSEIEFMDI